MPSFSSYQRSYEPELMDCPDISYPETERCLLELELINRASLAYRPTLKWLEAMVRTGGKRIEEPLRILDVACGGGDTLRRIHSKALRQGIKVELVGIDLNPHAIAFARQRTPPNAPITYLSGDIFNLKSSGSFHFIVTSLFTHHLTGAEIIRLLQWLESNAACGWFINDLHRHWLSYYFVKGMAALLPVGPMVRNDAPVSVARSFTAGDWRDLLKQAGFNDIKADIRWYFPFRYGVSWKKF